MQEAQSNLNSTQACNNEKEIRQELKKLEEHEQVFWMQKSRENWIIQGDRNTKYFHTVIAKKRIRWKITGLFDNQGKWIDDKGGIFCTFLEHFRNMFNSPDALPGHKMKRRLDTLNIPKFKGEHQDVLGKPFTAEEVKLVAFQIGPLKAPGIDGKPNIFLSQILECCW